MNWKQFIEDNPNLSGRALKEKGKTEGMKIKNQDLYNLIREVKGTKKNENVAEAGRYGGEKSGEKRGRIKWDELPDKPRAYQEHPVNITVQINFKDDEGHLTKAFYDLWFWHDDELPKTKRQLREMLIDRMGFFEDDENPGDLFGSQGRRVTSIKVTEIHHQKGREHLIDADGNRVPAEIFPKSHKKKK